MSIAGTKKNLLIKVKEKALMVRLLRIVTTDSNLMWSFRTRTLRDRNFNEEFGMTVEMVNNSSCLNYFELLFTDKVYQLILSETIRFECQKCDLNRNSQGHLHKLTVAKLKAWIGLNWFFNFFMKI